MICVINFLKLGLDIYFFYTLNFLCSCFALTRAGSGLPPHSFGASAFFNLIIGFLFSRQLISCVPWLFRSSALINSFYNRISILIIEEFFLPIMDIIVCLSFMYLFFMQTGFAIDNGLESLKQTSNNAKKFYNRNTHLLSQNIDAEKVGHGLDDRPPKDDDSFTEKNPNGQMIKLLT